MLKFLHESFKHSPNVAVALCAIASLLTACGTTPYQSLRENGGYSSRVLSNDTAVVEFEGLDSSSKGQHMDYALLRAAELTQKANFQYFLIENQRVEVREKPIRYSGTPARTETVTETSSNLTTGKVREYTKTVRIPATRDRIVKESRQIVTLHIRMLKFPVGVKGDPSFMEAQTVIKSIRAKYKLK